MFTAFGKIKNHIHIKPREVTIDNLAFRLHYRYTTAILLVATILVTSRQYIGEHIACVSETASVPANVMNTFCFFTATFTVQKYINHTLVSNGKIPHLGVGPMVLGDEVKKHNYYQWVPFVLFGQAVAFYIPHLYWKIYEGSRLSTFSDGLRATSFLKGTNTQEKINVVKKAFIERLHVYSSWAPILISCEFLNVVNLIVQVLLTDRFLAGGFYCLGGANSNPKLLDEVFPKVTKCTFHKYGPSGTLQSHDALCVLALNIINEKIFVFLWYWYIILFFVSIWALIWRFLAWMLHARSSTFNNLTFGLLNGRIDIWHGMTMTRNYYFSDWLFLRYLAKNMDIVLFQRLLRSLGESLDEGMDTPTEEGFPKVTELEVEYTELLRKEK